MNNAYTLFDSDGTTPLTPTYGTYWFGLLFPNSGGTTAKTFYLKVDAAVAGDSGQYVPVVWSLGTDKDGDGYLSRNWGDADCNDNDAAIHPLATDPVDTVDQNCDGTL
ncbi:MAG: putative metal-binding motif-containing protein [Deltaproteobacteria bacterium]|nr:putative metal-binding motif-containing protein [Deltaproteobacteria bacterium]